MESPITFSIRGFQQNQVFAKLRNQDLQAFNFATREIRAEVEMIERELQDRRQENSRAVRDMLRREWVLRGVIDYSLSMSVLLQVISKYERIDIVPLSYCQPELYVFQAKKLNKSTVPDGGQ